LLNSQYEVLAGTWPKNYNEVVLIVDKNHEVSDMLLYSIGVLDASEIEDMVKKLRNGEKLDDSDYVSKSYTFDELLDISFKLVLNTDYYVKNGNAWQDKTQDEAFLKDLVDNAPTIQVVGVVCPSENSSMIVSGGYIGYTHTLTEYVIQHVNDSEIAKQQLENPDVDVFTGIPFSSNDTIDFSNLTEEQKAAFAQMSEEELAAYIQSLAQAKEATYESNLEKLGIVDLDKPSMISIYPADFKGKEKIAQFISDYNAAQTDAGKPENTIEYSDIIGIMMSNVSMIINIITYVLIAFVGISLVVSSIMIGIITYISVLERTKEIGILRSIGASKRDISRVFNAETAIVGTVAGLLGIGITLILNIPINSIIFNLSGISGLSRLPFFGGVFLLALSVLLTMVAGLIPSKVAAKKDPVEALRSE
jgi:putative ABC transport system permease protein